jgi:hypothetical protein
MTEEFRRFLNKSNDQGEMFMVNTVENIKTNGIVPPPPHITHITPKGIVLFVDATKQISYTF